jgi:hypothetical protein
MSEIQQEIIKKISAATKELQDAHRLAVKQNPMAQDLPVFQKLVRLQKELGEAMQEISKVRGL